MMTSGMARSVGSRSLDSRRLWRGLLLYKLCASAGKLKAEVALDQWLS